MKMYWKYWVYRKGRLVSPYFGTTWAPDSWTVGLHLRDGRWIMADQECNCGIWSHKYKKSCFDSVFNEISSKIDFGDIFVVGHIQLAGWIVEEKNGFVRSAMGRPDPAGKLVLVSSRPKSVLEDAASVLRLVYGLNVQIHPGGR